MPIDFEALVRDGKTVLEFEDSAGQPCRGKLRKVAPLLWRCDSARQHLWIGNPDVRLTPVTHESERALASELEIAGYAIAAAEARAEQAEAEVAALARLCYRHVQASEGEYYRIVLDTVDRQARDHATEAEAIAAVRAAAGLDAGREDSHAGD